VTSNDQRVTCPGGAEVEETLKSAEYRQLVQLLRAVREHAGLTQAELAARIDEPQSVISAIERGKRRVDPIELRQILEAMGPAAAGPLAALDAFTAALVAVARDRG
jgi:transcriptional regulator with XRE-family HTH domain